jgi:GntR family transcriptional regulator
VIVATANPRLKLFGAAGPRSGNRNRQTHAADHQIRPARTLGGSFPRSARAAPGGSLYEILELRSGVKPAEAQETIEVVSATNDEAMVLDVISGSPLFSILRTSVDDQGIPFEYSHDLFGADRTRISIRTHGDGGITSAPNMARGVVGLNSHVL